MATIKTSIDIINQKLKSEFSNFKMSELQTNDLREEFNGQPSVNDAKLQLKRKLQDLIFETGLSTNGRYDEIIEEVVDEKFRELVGKVAREDNEFCDDNIIYPAIKSIENGIEHAEQDTAELKSNYSELSEEKRPSKEEVVDILRNEVYASINLNEIDYIQDDLEKYTNSSHSRNNMLIIDMYQEIRQELRFELRKRLERENEMFDKDSIEYRKFLEEMDHEISSAIRRDAVNIENELCECSYTSSMKYLEKIKDFEEDIKKDIERAIELLDMNSLIEAKTVEQTEEKDNLLEEKTEAERQVKEAAEKARAEEQARKEAEEQAKKDAEAEARAEEEAKKIAEEKARVEEQARKEAEEQAKKDAEAKLRAEEEARKIAEEKARAEEQARKEAEKAARDDQMRQNEYSAAVIFNRTNNMYSEMKKSANDHNKLCDFFEIDNYDQTELEYMLHEINNTNESVRNSATYSDIDKVADKMSRTLSASSGLKNIGNLYKDELDNEFKEKLYNKIQAQMKEIRIEKYKQELEGLKNKKPSIIDRFTGKKALDEEKITNVELKLKLEKEKNIQEPDVYKIRNMMADIYVFSQNETNGQVDPRLSEIYEKMQSKFSIGGKKITDEYIMQMANDRINRNQQNALITTDNKRKSIFSRNKQETSTLKAENEVLKQQIIEEESNKDFCPKVKTNSAVSKVSEVLREMKDIVQDVELDRQTPNMGMEIE